MSGWSGFLGGVLSGAVMGLLFHREDWLGGYGSRERRMVRLGHISFFGIGLINLFFCEDWIFETLPLQVHFDLVFQSVAGSWRLFEISVWTAIVRQ